MVTVQPCRTVLSHPATWWYDTDILMIWLSVLCFCTDVCVASTKSHDPFRQKSHVKKARIWAAFKFTSEIIRYKQSSTSSAVQPSAYRLKIGLIIILKPEENQPENVQLKYSTCCEFSRRDKTTVRVTCFTSWNTCWCPFFCMCQKSPGAHPAGLTHMYTVYYTLFYPHLTLHNHGYTYLDSDL